MTSISGLEFSLTFESSHEINFHFIKNIPSSIFDVLKNDCIVYIIVVYDKGQSCNRQPEIYTVSHSESHQNGKLHPSVMLNKQ